MNGEEYVCQFHLDQFFMQNSISWRKYAEIDIEYFGTDWRRCKSGTYSTQIQQRYKVKQVYTKQILDFIMLDFSTV